MADYYSQLFNDAYVWDNSHYKKKLGSARTAVNVKELTAPRRILGTKSSATAKVISRFCR